MDIQSLGATNVPSLLAGIVISLLLPGAISLLTAFQSSFAEFSQEISEADMICKISIQKSTRIRKLYPLLLTVEMVLVPLFLAVEKLFSCSLLIVLGIVVLMTGYVVLATPYTHQLENMRLLVHRIIILAMVTLYVAVDLKTECDDADGSFISTVPYVICGLLLVGGVINGLDMSWRIYRWCRKRGAID